MLFCFIIIHNALNPDFLWLIMSIFLIDSENTFHQELMSNRGGEYLISKELKIVFLLNSQNLHKFSAAWRKHWSKSRAFKKAFYVVHSASNNSLVSFSLIVQDKANIFSSSTRHVPSRSAYQWGIGEATTKGKGVYLLYFCTLNSISKQFLFYFGLNISSVRTSKKIMKI